jgi:hypothetical protein
MSLLARARGELEREFRPAGYNVGINDGDQEDPRGGVRWVIPSKAAYWNENR